MTAINVVLPIFLVMTWLPRASCWSLELHVCSQQLLHLQSSIPTIGGKGAREQEFCLLQQSLRPKTYSNRPWGDPECGPFALIPKILNAKPRTLWNKISYSDRWYSKLQAHSFHCKRWGPFQLCCLLCWLQNKGVDGFCSFARGLVILSKPDKCPLGIPVMTTKSLSSKKW